MIIAGDFGNEGAITIQTNKDVNHVVNVKGCTFAEGYELQPVGEVTFENCTIGDVALTADNLATLVISNIENVTVK